MLGAQSMYIEVDDQAFLKQLIRFFLERQYDHSKAFALQIIDWKPNDPCPVDLPWALIQRPKMFPIMRFEGRGLSKGYPWDASFKPTQVFEDMGNYSALDQLLYQFDHYYQMNMAQWLPEFRQRFPEPDIDGHTDIGLALTSGHFDGPLVLGLCHAIYHK